MLFADKIGRRLKFEVVTSIFFVAVAVMGFIQLGLILGTERSLIQLKYFDG